MRTDVDGKLQFCDANQLFTQCQQLDYNNPVKGFGKLFVRCTFRVGKCQTNKGSEICCMQMISGSEQLEVVLPGGSTTYKDLALGLRALAIPPRDIVVGYNCHGFALADSSVWIDDKPAEPILKDDYVELAEAQATIVAFYKGGQLVHTARRIEVFGKPRYQSKAGVRGMTIEDTVQKAGRDIGYDDVKYFKPI